MSSSLHSHLIRFARKIVNTVQSQLEKQLTAVQEQAAAPMRAMIEQVVGGVWVGHGANNFVEEVSNLTLPGVGKIGDQITATQRNIDHAIDTIDRADEEITNLVNGLADQFANIYQ